MCSVVQTSVPRLKVREIHVAPYHETSDKTREHNQKTYHAKAFQCAGCEHSSLRCGFPY